MMLSRSRVAVPLYRRISCLAAFPNTVLKDVLKPETGLCSLSLQNGFSQAAIVEVEQPLPDLPVPDPKFAEIIRGVPRDGEGKAVAGREKRAGRVPSIVYSLEDGDKGGHKQLISVETKQIARLLKRIGYSFFLSRTFELEIRPTMDSEDIISRERVLPRQVHLHAGTDEILNATFLRAPPEAIIKVDVPLLYRGEDACPGIRRGGYLNTIKRVVKFRCPADYIPPYIEVNLSDLEIKDKVLLRDLKVHHSVKLVEPKDYLPVCKIMGTRFVESARTASS